MLFRILLLSIHFILDQLKSNRRREPPRIVIGRALDLMFWLGATWLVAWALGALEFPEIKERGYGAIVPLVLGLLWVGVKFLVCVILPTLAICGLLQQYESLTPRLVIYGICAAIAAVAYHRIEARAAAAAAELVRASKEKELAQERAMERAQAEATARRYDEEHRGDYLKDLMVLASKAQTQWLRDLEAAGLVGRDDEPPPVLEVTDPMRHTKQVKNTASETLCVQLVRARHVPRDDTYQQCENDLRLDCVNIAPGKSAHFSLVPDRTRNGCDDGFLQFRVGGPMMKGPSWWSYSAVRSLKRDPPNLRKMYEKFSVPQIKEEIERVEELLEETDRAARWRRVLRPSD